MLLGTGYNIILVISLFAAFVKELSPKIMAARFPTPLASLRYFGGSHHLNISCKRDDLALGPHTHQFL